MQARRWGSVVAVALMCVSAACGRGEKAEWNDLSDLPPLAGPEPSNDPLANLPATFKGDLPCLDCTALRYHLNLFPDQTYNLRVEAVDKGEGPKDDIGNWVLSSDRRAIVLRGNRGTEFFGLASGTALRRLDSEARENDAASKTLVVKASRFQPLDVALTLRGAYVYMAETATFTECATGRRWPVASEGASEDLERAYLSAHPATGQAVVIAVEGRIASRTRLDGTGTRASLVVDRVVGPMANQACGQRYSSMPLEGTDWKLVRVGNAAPGGKASLTLDPAGQVYAASGGCNQLAGSYQRNGGQISFVGAINERRTCESAMEADQAFKSALAQARRWRVLGSIMELSDMSGKMLARFEAER